jgi:hypothetical protein
MPWPEMGHNIGIVSKADYNTLVVGTQNGPSIICGCP